MDRPRVVIGKATIDRVTFKEAVAKILAFAKTRESHFVVTPNADHILQLERDAGLLAAYHDASLVTCDGRPVLWASRFLGTPLPGAVTGADLMPSLCKYGAHLGLKVAIVGGPSGAAEAAAKNLSERYPGVSVVWTYSPPFGFEKDPAESSKIVERLNHSDVDIVFLGVGAPKQELWMHAHKNRLRVGVMLGIGAAIEFAASSLPRAPKLMRHLGFEWAFRLWHDPSRLARRYLRDTRLFVIVLRQWAAAFKATHGRRKKS